MPTALLIARNLGHLMFFLAGLLGGALLVGRAAPFPEIPQVTQKLALLREAPQPYDTIFLGSSKVFSGVIPETFDRVAAEHGRPTHSFNLGIDGMGFPESAYLCEVALAQRPGTIRSVFLELGEVRTIVPQGQRDTRRAVYWHDLHRTALVCRAILAGHSTGDPRWAEPSGALLRRHLGLWLKRLLRRGDGAEFAEETLLGGSPAPAANAFDPTARGYRVISSTVSGQDLEEYRKGIAQFAAPRRAANAVSEEAVRALATRVQRAGATLFLIMWPNPIPSPEFFTRAGQQAQLPTVFRFDQPEELPQLFAIENRGDYVHLNDRGAREFTATLAERYARHRAEAGSAR